MAGVVTEAGAAEPVRSMKLGLEGASLSRMRVPELGRAVVAGEPVASWLVGE